MKKAHAITVWRFLLVPFIFFSCSDHDQRIAVNLYEKRAYLLEEFRDITIMTRGTFYSLSYYKSQSVNTFFFDRKDDSLMLTNDTLQYPVTEIAAFVTTNISDSSGYKKSLNNELHRLVRIMDEFEIINLSADSKEAGVDMKINFGDFKALLYVKNIAAVNNERWKNYILSGEKFDENWYYVKDELSD